MQIKIKHIVYTGIALLLLFLGYKVAEHFKDSEIEKLETEIRKNKIRDDKLVKIDSTTYRKLLADTLTKRQLENRIRELEIKVENPKIVEVIRIVPKEVKDKETDKVEVTDSIISIEDFYPQKENYFIKYSSKISLSNYKGVSDWSFKPQDIKLVIGENNDGTYEIRSKVPEFLNITELDIQSQPIKKRESDNFGWLLGAGYGTDLGTKEEYLNVQAGIRLKKTYFTVNGGTNNTLNGTLTFEF